MAFTDKSPAAWLGAGYNSSTGKIELNTFDAPTNKLLIELTDAEADETTGDIRKLMFGVIEGLYTKIKPKLDSLDAANRPSQFTFFRSNSVADDGGVTRVYNFTFRLAPPSAVEVADEPTA